MLKLTTAIAAVMISAAPVLADNGPCRLIDKGGYKTWNNGACATRVENNTHEDKFGGAPEADEAEPSEPSEPSEPGEEV